MAGPGGRGPGDAELWQGPLPEEARGGPGEPWQGHRCSSAGGPALWSRFTCAPGPGHTPHPSEAAREAPGWTLGFCTQISFPDFQGISGVCSREPAPVALNPMATLQVLGRSSQAQSWRRMVGCRQLARSVSRGRRGHGQSSSRKVPAGSWPGPTAPLLPGLICCGGLTAPAQPNGPLAAWPGPSWVTG